MALVGEMQYLTIGDSTYSIAGGGPSVSVTPTLSSGTKSATITVDSVGYDLYAPTVPTNISSFTNDVGYITSADVPEGSSAYTGTISAVSTTASSGTNNGFARGDHVHNITGTTITSALGYTPYNSTNPNGYTTNAGTVTSVRVQATSPVQSSVSTAQSSTLNTTISLADGYGDTKNPYGTKTANYILAGPASGSAAVPSFRALVAADIPDLSGTYLTKTYSENQTTGTLAWENEGFSVIVHNSGVEQANWIVVEGGYIELGSGTDDNHSFLSMEPTSIFFQFNDTNTVSLPNNKSGTIALTSDIPTVPTNVSAFTNDAGYITSYTDENMKWTASTSSNTYYPLASTSTATTSTANTLNGINFYQYYNTAGGYRRLVLGNTTAYKSTGGAYGTIRLYGAAATYYGDLVPGVLGTTSGDGHISANRTWTLPDKTGTIALTTDIPTVPTKTSDLTNDSGFITSYTETDPIFSASAAAGITSTDISNWNSIISDDHKWNDVSLTHSLNVSGNDFYVPMINTVDGTAAIFNRVSNTPMNYAIAKYGTGAYLYSTTPSANDNSTKVATTAYVDAAIPDISGYVSKSGDTMSGNLAISSYNLTFTNSNAESRQTTTISQKYMNSMGSYIGYLSVEGATIRNSYTPTHNYDLTNKQYVDNSISGITIPTKTSDLTNDSGFITANDVPTEVFWATYDTTTSAEIEAAYQAGKEVLVKYNGYVYRLTRRVSSTSHNFECTEYNVLTGAQIYDFSCYNDTWTARLSTTLVPTTTTINGKALSANIALTASDIGAAPDSIKINGQFLNQDITLTASDVGALPDTTPYVTEEGTSNSWTYRKWSSGKIEAWIHNYTFASASWSTWSSPIRYMDKTFTIPSDIFTTAPNTMATSTSNQYWVVDSNASSATAGNMRIASCSSSATATYVNIYAWTD